VTLYRLQEAVRQGDATALRSLVHWPKVRDGIKEDICDFLFEPPVASANGPALASGALPAFGQSFVRGIASNVVDRRVTPEGLAASFQPPGTQVNAASHTPDVRLSWAFFESATEFLVSLHAPGQAEDIRVQLELSGARWRVTRVWLPVEMLRQANGVIEVQAPAQIDPRGILSVAYVAPKSLDGPAFSMGDARE
jgi:hypothetical protein